MSQVEDSVHRQNDAQFSRATEADTNNADDPGERGASTSAVPEQGCRDVSDGAMPGSHGSDGMENRGSFAERTIGTVGQTVTADHS